MHKVINMRAGQPPCVDGKLAHPRSGAAGCRQLLQKVLSLLSVQLSGLLGVHLVKHLFHVRGHFGFGHHPVLVHVARFHELIHVHLMV